MFLPAFRELFKAIDFYHNLVLGYTFIFVEECCDPVQTHENLSS